MELEDRTWTDRIHDRRRHDGHFDLQAGQRVEQLPHVVFFARCRRDHRKPDAEAGADGVGDQMGTVEEDRSIGVPARGVAKARHERVLPAGNGHSGRIALWYD